MKGPGFRYDLDIRRVWECPQCKKRLRHLGHITSRRCQCDDEGHWMKIVEERFRRTFPAREKIVIPEEESAATPETPVEQAATSDSPEPEEVNTGPTTETAEPRSGADASPPTEDEPPQPGPGAQQAPTSDSDSEEPRRRKKRRKKRRRKKNRGKQPPDAAGNQGPHANNGS